jgi:hypothetical protein
MDEPRLERCPDAVERLEQGLLGLGWAAAARRPPPPRDLASAAHQIHPLDIGVSYVSR